MPFLINSLRSHARSHLPALLYSWCCSSESNRKCGILIIRCHITEYSPLEALEMEAQGVFKYPWYKAGGTNIPSYSVHAQANVSPIFLIFPIESKDEM